MLRQYCNQITASQIDEQINLSGWVHRRRDHGGLIFIDLRDRSGIVQVVFDPEKVESFELAQRLRNEYVVNIKGIVRHRPEGTVNPNMATGEIEILAHQAIIYNSTQDLPFNIDEYQPVGEDTRLKFRYLDLRRPEMIHRMTQRSNITRTLRRFLDQYQFMEVETPILTKSTPEGARDYLVPSRNHKGQFYALPQSPQLFKQLLMMSGFDRYYQIARCFRDEDLRADRQPEFTQIDCEMSFVTQEDILETFEGLTKHLFKSVLNVDLPNFPRLTYADAIKLYGSDKPDTRFGMKFIELNSVAKNKGFKVFDDVELVVGINIEGCAAYSRKQLDKITNFVKRPQVGANGLVYVKYNEDGTFKSSVDKFFNQEQLKEWANESNAKPGDLLLVLAGETNKVRSQLNELRLHMGEELGLRNPSVFKPLWVVDFPLLEWDDETSRFHAMHHPFTSPKEEDLDKMESNPGEVRANAYDLCMNGVELGGGSIRIFDKSLQKRMFDLLGFTEEEAKEQFGFLMNAFEYGAPPHGGLAFGFDRLCAMLGGQDSIRDFIAFPKNNSGRDVMINSPSEINIEQLNELNISLKK